MQIPYKFATPWASAAVAPFITPVIPVAQSGAPNGATQQQGYPPITGTNPAAGGIPPSMADWNGAMFYCTAWLQYLQAGAPIGYDSVFSMNIGGYPPSAIIAQASGNGQFWLNNSGTNNATNPDLGGAGWTLWPPPQTQVPSLRIIGTTGNVANVTNLTLNNTTVSGGSGLATATPIPNLLVGENTGGVSVPNVISLFFSGATVSQFATGGAQVTIPSSTGLSVGIDTPSGDGGTALIQNVNNINLVGPPSVGVLSNGGQSFATLNPPGTANIFLPTLFLVGDGGGSFTNPTEIIFIGATVASAFGGSPNLGRATVTITGGGGGVTIPSLGGLYSYFAAMTASPASDGNNNIFPGTPSPGHTQSGLQEMQGYSVFSPASPVGPLYPGTWLCLGPTCWAMPGGTQGLSQLNVAGFSNPQADWFQITVTLWARIA